MSEGVVLCQLGLWRVIKQGYKTKREGGLKTTLQALSILFGGNLDEIR
jgi:hypothetical protein